METFDEAHWISLFSLFAGSKAASAAVSSWYHVVLYITSKQDTKVSLHSVAQSVWCCCYWCGRLSVSRLPPVTTQTTRAYVVYSPRANTPRLWSSCSTLSVGLSQLLTFSFRSDNVLSIAYVCIGTFMFAQTTLQPRLSRRRRCENVYHCALENMTDFSCAQNWVRHSDGSRTTSGSEFLRAGQEQAKLLCPYRFVLPRLYCNKTTTPCLKKPPTFSLL